MDASKFTVEIPNDAWKEQLARLRRWYSRTRPISRERLAVSEDDLDILFAFFQNCWHLYDWLKNSGAVSDQILESFFRQSAEMKFCYDICIGTKHLQIDRPKAGINVLIRQVEYGGENIGDIPTQNLWFPGGNRRLAYLADQCMAQIEHFVSENHLG